MHIDAISDPFSLQQLAASIRCSSNFRFAWQFFTVQADDLDSAGTVAAVLRVVIAKPQLHAFFAKSLDGIDPRHFEIEPLHKHASIVLDSSTFLDTMVRASTLRHRETENSCYSTATRALS